MAATPETETADVDSECPPELAAQIRAANLAVESTGQLIGDLNGGGSTVRCQSLLIVELGSRVASEAVHSEVMREWLGSVATYSRFFDDDDRQKLTAVYAGMPANSEHMFTYYSSLVVARIDIRDRLRGSVDLDWNVGERPRESETWQHMLYLASFDEPGALDAIAGKIAATPSGHTVTILLQSLGTVRTDAVREVLQRYADDTRRADGSSGPGPTIAQTVEGLLAAGSWE